MMNKWMKRTFVSAITVGFTGLSVVTNTVMVFAEVPATEGITVNAPVEVHTTTEVTVPKLQPTLTLTAKKIEGNLIRFVWNGVEGAVGYELFKNGMSYQTFTVDAALETYTYTDEQPIIAEEDFPVYTLRAYDAAQMVIDEKIVAKDKEVTVPSASPSNFVIMPRTSPYVTDLQWGTVLGAVKYNVYRDGEYIGEVPHTDQDTLMFQDQMAGPNVQYVYEVSALNEDNLESERVSALAPAMDTMAPAIPENLSGKAVKSNQVHLTWTAIEGVSDLQSYRVYMRMNQEPFKLATISNENFYIAEGLGPNQNYDFQVTAVDLNGNESGFSQTFSVKTGANPTDVAYEKLPLQNDGNVVISKIENGVEYGPLLASEDKAKILDTKLEYGREEQATDLPVAE